MEVYEKDVQIAHRIVGAGVATDEQARLGSRASSGLARRGKGKRVVLCAQEEASAAKKESAETEESSVTDRFRRPRRTI